MKVSIQFLLLIVSLIVFSCNDAIPRKPIQVKSGQKVSYSVDRTKRQLNFETNLIKKYIKADSLVTYNTSNRGYWFSVLKKDSTQTYIPNFGDKVVYTYDVKNLNNQIIYSKSDLGELFYFVDQENPPIEGFRSCLKSMKEGDVYKCIFPSQLAYGYTGDRKRIGVNTPLVCTIQILKIIKEEVK